MPNVLDSDSEYGTKMKNCIKTGFSVTSKGTVINRIRCFVDSQDQIALLIFCAIAQELGKLTFGLRIIRKFYRSHFQEGCAQSRYGIIKDDVLKQMYQELGIDSLENYRQPGKTTRGIVFLIVADNSCYVRAVSEPPKTLMIIGGYYFVDNTGPYKIGKDQPYPIGKERLIGVYRKRISDLDMMAKHARNYGDGVGRNTIEFD